MTCPKVIFLKFVLELQKLNDYLTIDEWKSLCDDTT